MLRGLAQTPSCRNVTPAPLLLLHVAWDLHTCQANSNCKIRKELDFLVIFLICALVCISNMPIATS